MALIRCKECREAVEETEQFCPECGAIFVPPFEYIQDEKKVLENIKIPEKKSFEEMNNEEKLHSLNEKCADVRDELVKLRYDIKQKADECMRCFTAAGIARAQDFDDEMSNMLWKRKENLEELEMVTAEYKNILNKIDDNLKQLDAAKEDILKFKQNS